MRLPAPAQLTRRLPTRAAGLTALLPGLITIAIFLAWDTDQDGYFPESWYPGALVVLALLVITMIWRPVRWRLVPTRVRVATGLLGAYTAWSYLSISWAGARADAWTGANRTLCYLVIFMLFALWRRRAHHAALLLGAWTLAMIVLATVELLHVSSLVDPLGGGDRLTLPAGYVNAAAATWLMPVWPALLLAARREVRWPLRALFGAGCVILVSLSLLSQSRGAFYSLPIVLVAYFVLVPSRLRSLIVLAPIAVAVGLVARPVLDVASAVDAGHLASPVLRHATNVTILAAAVTAGVIGLIAIADAAVPRQAAIRDLARRAGRVVAAVIVVVALGGAVAVAGNPITRAHHAWTSFKGGYTSATTHAGRLTGGLGSHRYDFYRVALDSVHAHPLQGIGADNFFETYLALGRSAETPHYPHSLEMRTLADTGLVGAVLLGGAILAALLAGLRRRPSSAPLARCIAGAAGVAFLYWAVHGSFDWFWEIAGLGGPAFALLGLSAAVEPPASAAAVAALARRHQSARSQRRLSRRSAGILVAVAAVVPGVSLLAPYLAQRDVDAAVHSFQAGGGSQPAYAMLHRAATLNPLSPQPLEADGSIAIATRDLPRARQDFARALERDPREAYATLQLGVLTGQLGSASSSTAILERAQSLSPRSAIARRALESASAHHPLSAATVETALLASPVGG